MPFTENFDASNANWYASANGYTPFWAKDGITGTWKAENVSFVDGRLVLKLEVTKTGDSVVAYGGEYGTNATFGYGTYRWRMRAGSTSATATGLGAAVSGSISAGFNYINNSETEIDFEFQSHMPKVASIGHWQTLTNSHHQDVTLPFSPSEEFHDYAFVWKAGEIRFYIDGTLVRTTTQNVPTTAAHFLFNFWPTNSNGFGGVTNGSGTYYMYVENFSYDESTTPLPDGEPFVTPQQSYPAEYDPSVIPEDNGTDGVVARVATNSMNVGTLWNEWRVGISYMAMFDQIGWPHWAGTIVHDNIIYDPAFVKQYLYEAGGNRVWLRSANSDGTWAAWREITNAAPTAESGEIMVKIAPNSRLETDGPAAYPIAAMSYMAYFQEGATKAWPTTSGEVVTNRIQSDPKYTRQTFHATASSKTWFRRSTDDGNGWTEWEAIGGSSSSREDGYPRNTDAMLGTGRSNKGMITFLMDDGFIEDRTIMYPMLSAKGYPGVVAAISQYVDAPDPSRLDVPDLLFLQKAGWEIMSHTDTHPFLANLTQAQVRNELELSKKKLTDAGLYIESFVYPFGSHNAMVRDEVRKLYRSGFDVERGVNKIPVKQFTLHRVPMGSFVDPGYDTAAYYKTWVDRAKNENAWVVFLLHTGPAQQSSLQTSYIQETVDYIALQGVPVVTGKQALDQMGNLLDAGDYGQPNAGYTIIDGTGRLHSSGIVPAVQVAQATYNNASPASAFPLGITTMIVGGADNGGFPMDIGTLENSRFHADINFTRQKFTQYNTNRTFHRAWVEGAWTAWAEQAFLGNTANAVIGSTSIRTIIWGIIPWNGFVDYTSDMAAIGYGDNILVNPMYGIEAGFDWQVWTHGTNFTIRMYNRRSDQVDMQPTSQEWVITILNTV